MLFVIESGRRGAHRLVLLFDLVVYEIQHPRLIAFADLVHLMLQKLHVLLEAALVREVECAEDISELRIRDLDCDRATTGL